MNNAILTTAANSKDYQHYFHTRTFSSRRILLRNYRILHNFPMKKPHLRIINKIN